MAEERQSKLYSLFKTSRCMYWWFLS